MMTFAPSARRTPARAGVHGAMLFAGAASAIRVGAILRPTYGAIRVWTHNWRAPEEFTIAEARGLCARIDAVLAIPAMGDPDAGVWIDHDGAKLALVAPRQWFVAFLAAVRREIRKWDRSAEAAIARQVDC